MIDIPQSPETYRFLSMFYSDFEGFPPPLTNGGVNEHQVAVRDVWAPSRVELVRMTRVPQKGPQYSDLARLVLERARTARQGVELIGELIDRYGFTTYGGNTHLIADPDEGWVVWEFAGSQGLWVAERLGPGDVRVLYPGHVEEVPLTYRSDPNYMGSANLITFAEQQGWYDREAGKPFNVFKIYGTQEAPVEGLKLLSSAEIEDALRAAAPVSEAEMMARVRDHRIAGDEAGYGQVVSLRKGLHAELVRLWVAPTGSVAAPFNPWWIGVQEVNPEYGRHRYLARDSGSRFLHPDFQMQEATEFAGRTFKRVLYYMCERPKIFRPIIETMLIGFEGESRRQLERVESSARALLDAGRQEDAEWLLTYYANTRADKALALGGAMIDWMEAYYKLRGGLRAPEGNQINDQDGNTVNCLSGYDPDAPDPSR